MGRRRRRRAKRGKARAVFVKSVSHPGTKAQPFLKPALEGAEALLSRLVGKVLRRLGTKNRARFIRSLDDQVRKVAFAVKTRAQRLVPVVTGRLKGSINVRQLRLLNYSIGTNVEYALFIEEGTKPHTIFPRERQFLRFVVKGQRRRRGRGGRST